MKVVTKVAKMVEWKAGLWAKQKVEMKGVKKAALMVA